MARPDLQYDQKLEQIVPHRELGQAEFQWEAVEEVYSNRNSSCYLDVEGSGQFMECLKGKVFLAVLNALIVLVFKPKLAHFLLLQSMGKAKLPHLAGAHVSVPGIALPQCAIDYGFSLR